MKELIGIITVLIAFVAYVPYFRDILKGKTKPHPYSWLIWALITYLVFALQISKGSGPGSYVTFSVGIISFVVFLLGLKYGTKDITLFDTACLVAALLAAALWLLAKQPLTSIILLVSIDALGMIPTVRKSWKKPHEETLLLWSVNGFRHALSIAAIRQYNTVTLLNPVTWAIGNSLFAILLVVRRRQLAKLKQRQV